ncbi:MAG: alpha/beta fold hydrolase, partial [Planctomycetes bacterium]|nr:alpha/beta fold hydrolase [Planctomycetota bacterium]
LLMNSPGWGGFAWIGRLLLRGAVLLLDELTATWALTLGLCATPWVLYRARRDARRWRGPARPVVLAHGYMYSAGTMGPLVRALERAGFGPAVPVDYSSFRNPERAVSKIVDAVRALAETCGGVPVAVLGHSLGGLIVRLAREQCPQIGPVVTLAGPHKGTWAAALAIGPMRGLLFRGLDLPTRRDDLAIGGGMDLVVDVEHAVLAPPARNLRIDTSGHSTMLLDPRIVGAVVEHLGSCAWAADDPAALVVQRGP